MSVLVSNGTAASECNWQPLLSALNEKVRELTPSRYTDARGFRDIALTQRLLRLMFCFHNNINGKIYNGEVTPYMQSAPVAVFEYLNSASNGQSFYKFIHNRRELALNVLAILNVWLPSYKSLESHLFSVHHAICHAYDIFALSSIEREFIEVDLKGDTTLIKEHYNGWDPRYPDEDSDEEDRSVNHTTDDADDSNQSEETRGSVKKKSRKGRNRIIIYTSLHSIPEEEESEGVSEQETLPGLPSSEVGERGAAVES
jgi:hypothetical protein